MLFSLEGAGPLGGAVYRCPEIVLTSITRRLGRQTENPTIIALASDHRNDAFAACAVSVGIVLGRMGYVWVDPLAGAGAALIILRTGIEILRVASAELMDTVPSRELHQKIVHMLTKVPGVREVEEKRAHRFGPYWVVNVTIGVDGDINVTEGDRIASQVEQCCSVRSSAFTFTTIPLPQVSRLITIDWPAFAATGGSPWASPAAFYLMP